MNAYMQQQQMSYEYEEKEHPEITEKVEEIKLFPDNTLFPGQQQDLSVDLSGVAAP